MLYFRRRPKGTMVNGVGFVGEYLICNQIETFGTNYDFVISFEIGKDDWYEIKEMEEERYTGNRDVSKDSLKLFDIITNRSEYFSEESGILNKPAEVYDMELELIGNDEILDYLHKSLEKVLEITTDKDTQKNIESHLIDYYNHLINSLNNLTELDYENKKAEVLFYDSESSTDLLVNDYYLTNLLLNGLLSNSNNSKLNLELDEGVLMKLLNKGEIEYFNFLTSIKK